MLKRLLALMPFAPASRHAREISEVRVLDPDFQPFKTITDAADLAAFNELWSAKTVRKTERLGGVFYTLIVIRRSGRSDRWFYDPAGFLQVLSKARVPVYGVADRDAFNKLLAIDPQRLSR